MAVTGLFLLVSLAFMSTVCGFVVEYGPAARALDLRVDNIDLLSSAALTGQNVTADIRRESQLVISQDGVFLAFDCSSLLPEPPGMPPPIITWKRRSSPNKTAAPLVPGDQRIQVLGVSDSILRLNPTNIIIGGERADNGDYTCTLCTTGPGEQTCISRSTTLFLVGSFPELESGPQAGCEIRLRALVCEVGANISVPHTIDTDTGERSLDIDRLVITCNEERAVLPRPTYTWTKDGAVVVREASQSSRIPAMIDEEFLMQGNNSLLLLIQPVPIMVTTSLNIEVDFTATNISAAIIDMLPVGEMAEDRLRMLILESILGDWQCTVSNVFGNDSRTSTVFVDNNCTNGCRNCSGLGMCVATDSTCQCVCPPGYSYAQDSSNCEDIDECSSNHTHDCSSATCVNTEGGFNCTCKEGHVLYSGNNSCLDCRLGFDLENGRVEAMPGSSDGEVVAMAACDDGFVSPPGFVVCFVSTDSSGEVGVVREGELMCLKKQDSGGGCGKSCYIPIIVGGVVLLLLLLLLLIVILLIIYYQHKGLKHGYAVTV